MKGVAVKLGLLGLAVGIGYYVMVHTSGTVIEPQLTSRAKEYITERAGSNDTQWKQLNAPRARIAQEEGSTVNIDSCFSFVLPFGAVEVRKEGDCAYRIFLDSPKGYIVAYRHQINASSADDVSDISMRRLYRDQYRESTASANGRQFMIFKHDGDTYEKSGFLLSGGSLYVLNLVVPTNDNLDRQFDVMIRSVIINE